MTYRKLQGLAMQLGIEIAEEYRDRMGEIFKMFEEFRPEDDDMSEDMVCALIDRITTTVGYDFFIQWEYTFGPEVKDV